jgi:hypothetical protein
MIRMISMNGLIGATAMTRTTCSLVPVLMFLSASAAAAPARLLPAAAGDVASADVVASAAPSTAPVGGPVRFTWPIDQSADDLSASAPHRAESTSHARTLTRAALRRGVAVAVSEPGALIKLSPRSGGLRDLTVVDPRGRALTDGDGLRSVGADPNAFTVDPARGVGLFVVRGAADDAVHLDVREPGSDVVLAVQAASDVAFVGDRVSVHARLARDGQLVPGARITARLVDPQGQTRDEFVRGRDGRLHAELHRRTDATPGGALWSVEVTAEATVDGVVVRRSVTTAVAVSVPTARYTGAADVDPASGVRVGLELDVASPGRYAATAVLYGTNREGALQPIAVGQSADELAPGRRWLTLEFDAAAVTASGMRAPFELRDLRLADQGRMSVLHRQARGLPVAAR